MILKTFINIYNNFTSIHLQLLSIKSYVPRFFTINKMNLDTFIEKFGTGTTGLDPPKANDRHWPPIPEINLREAKDIYRYPDIIINAHGQATYEGETGETPYIEALFNYMEHIGIHESHKKPFINVFGKQIRKHELGMLYAKNGAASYVRPGARTQKDKTLVIYDITENYMNFDGYVHIIRVLPGKYVRVSINNCNVLLCESKTNGIGVHVIVDATLKYKGSYSHDASNINASPLHIINVQPGFIIPIRIGNEPHVLFTGKHVLYGFNIHVSNPIPENDTFVFGNIRHYILEHNMIGAIKSREYLFFVDKPCDLWFRSNCISTMIPQPSSTKSISYKGITRKLDNTSELDPIHILNNSVSDPKLLKVIASHISERGDALYYSKSYVESMRDFDICVTLEPNNTKHYYDRAWAKRKLHQLNESISDCLKCIDLGLTNNSIYYILTLNYMSINDYTTAKHYASKGHDLHGNTNHEKMLLKLQQQLSKY